MKAPRINTKNLKYVEITNHWRKIKPHIYSRNATHIWKSNMVYFCIEEDIERGVKFDIEKYIKYKNPAAFDWSDWRCERRALKWWDFTCRQACHFLVDLNLYLAIKTFPKYQWRIVTNHRKHSTVWNGDTKNPILFDMNFLALRIPIKMAWDMVAKGRVLNPGQPLNGFRYGVKTLFVC